MWHFFQEYFLWFGFAFFGVGATIFVVMFKKHLHDKGIYWNGSPEQRAKNEEFVKAVRELSDRVKEKRAKSQKTQTDI